MARPGKETNMRSGHTILYWMAGVLLILTLTSACLLCGLLAKYTVRGSASDDARVAKGGSVELWEHKAELDEGVYELTDTKVQSNAYDKVLPGVDIPKDPYIITDLVDSEVDYELYLKVIKSDNFPATVTFDLTDDWDVYDIKNGIYKYKGNLEQFREEKEDEDKIIWIIKGNKLYVSEHFVGDDGKTEPETFSLTFQAWLKQVD